MLTLYHSGSSVCSQKARLIFAEKAVPYDSRNLDMTKGEHQTPEYLALNPNGVVPTLVTETGVVVRESSVIIEFVDQLTEPRLMPTTGQGVWDTKLWLIRCIEIHAAVNSISFATVIRNQILDAIPPEKREGWLMSHKNAEIREKRRSLLEQGAASHHVDGALSIFDGVFRDMSAALAQGPWINGATFGLADCALVAYVDRIRRLGLTGLYEGRFAGIAEWLDAARSRLSYDAAIQSYYTAEAEAAYLHAGQAAWPEIVKRLTS